MSTKCALIDTPSCVLEYAIELNSVWI